MPLMRAQIGFVYDTQLPRDSLLITPHYQASDAVALGDALVTNLKANARVGTKPFTVAIYAAGTAPPHTPLFSGGQSGATPNSTIPREVSLCLSYFGQYNRPSFRGRLYIPGSLLTSPLLKVPSTTQMNEAGAFANTLGKNLPAGAYWVLYSRVKGSGQQVTDWWVDNEWDTVRSRGMRADSRVSGKV